MRYKYRKYKYVSWYDCAPGAAPPTVTGETPPAAPEVIPSVRSLKPAEVPEKRWHWQVTLTSTELTGRTSIL